MGYYTLKNFKPSESDFEAFKAVLITKAAQMLKVAGYKIYEY